MKDFFSQFKYNIVLALIITSLFVFIEQFYRIHSDILVFNLTIKKFLDQFLIHLIIVSIVSRRAILIIYSILLTFVWFQLIHFSYYNTWIFPLEYLLFFTQFGEIIDTFKTVLNITFVPFILVTITLFLIIIILNKSEKIRKKIPYSLTLFIGLLIYTPIEVYLKDTPYRHSKPDMENNPIKNSVFSLGNLFGIIIPKKYFQVSGLEQPISSTPILLNKTPDINIVVIMGESLHKDMMSLYDYPYKTTPFLDSLKEDQNFLYFNAISSSVFTVVSLASFFNMIQKPDGTPQILSRNTCLFKMAKDNGFNTYFYSVQSRDSMRGIKGYLCPSYIDILVDGSDITKNESLAAYDQDLVTQLDSVDFSKASFIALHQRASHTPFETTFPKNFEIFSKEIINNDLINQKTINYMNSISYTDYVLKEIINKLKSKTSKPTYVIFTSDHATNIENTNSYAHGQLNFKEIYQVPFFIYSINTKNNLKDNFGNFPFISHYQISNIVSSLLGYETGYEIFNKKEEFSVCGNDISGLGGQLKINFDENNNQIRDDKK